MPVQRAVDSVGFAHSLGGNYVLPEVERCPNVQHTASSRIHAGRLCRGSVPPRGELRFARGRTSLMFSTRLTAEVARNRLCRLRVSPRGDFGSPMVERRRDVPTADESQVSGRSTMLTSHPAGGLCAAHIVNASWRLSTSIGDTRPP